MTEQEKKMWQEDLDMIAKLNKEVDEMHNRIDKAINYIENAQTLDYGTTKEFNIKEFPFVQHILEILKGENE